MTSNFASLNFVISTLENFALNGVEITALDSLESEISRQVNWDMEISDLSFSTLSNIAAKLVSESFEQKDLTKIILTVSNGYSTVLSAGADIYQKTLLSFLTAVDPVIANRLAPFIMNANIIPERDENSLTMLSSELLIFAENATVDLRTFREKVLFAPQFSNLIFAFEILNEMRFQSGGVDLSILNQPIFFSIIREKIDWTGYPEDILTIELWSNIFKAFWPTVDYYLVAVGEDLVRFGQAVANSHVSIDLFCAQNGLDLGIDNFLATGECQCIENAETFFNEESQINACECSEGFSAAIEVDREKMTLTKSCQPDIVTVQVQLFQSFKSAINFDSRLLDRSNDFGLDYFNQVKSELSKVISGAFESFTIDEITFRKGAQLVGNR